MQFIIGDEQIGLSVPGHSSSRLSALWRLGPELRLMGLLHGNSEHQPIAVNFVKISTHTTLRCIEPRHAFG
jgi:hypothetical protein